MVKDTVFFLRLSQIFNVPLITITLEGACLELTHNTSHYKTFLLSFLSPFLLFFMINMILHLGNHVQNF